jgi:hypothetical protein
MLHGVKGSRTTVVFVRPRDIPKISLLTKTYVVSKWFDLQIIMTSLWQGETLMNTMVFSVSGLFWRYLVPVETKLWKVKVVLCLPNLFFNMCKNNSSKYFLRFLIYLRYRTNTSKSCVSQSTVKYRKNLKCPLKTKIWSLCLCSPQIRRALCHLVGLAVPLCKGFRAN